MRALSKKLKFYFPSWFKRFFAPHESRMTSSVSIMMRRAGFLPFSITSIKSSTALTPNFENGLPDGSQLNFGERRQRHVVKTNKCNIFRNAQPSFLNGAHCPNSHTVRRGKHRLRPGFDQFVHGVVTADFSERPFRNQGLIHWQCRLRSRRCISFQPVGCDGAVVVAGDGGDAPVYPHPVNAGWR